MADDKNKKSSSGEDYIQPVFRSPMQQMNDFFTADHPFGGLLNSIDSFFQRHAMEFMGGFPVDVYETADEWVVRAELPGVKKENIHIDTFSDRLRIAVRNDESTEVSGQNNYYRRERMMQQMQREIPLPYRINRQRTKARFLNGVLEVRGPKYPKTRNTLEIE